jgi:3-oxoacyl-[acyl-carrier-protein] synthase III
MKYSRVVIESLGYELAPVVVASDELEERLRPAYEKLRIPPGQLAALTGVLERRWWEPGFAVADGAIRAGRKALRQAGIEGSEVEALIYGGVCREHFEPATACRVADALGVSDGAAVFDISNACLGILNGMLEIANRIELGQIRAGLVVSCETARDIVELAIQNLCTAPTMDRFRLSLATLTGGSGAAAVLLTDGSFSGVNKPRLLGGVTRTAPEHHRLCRWGMEETAPAQFRPFMSTDSVEVLKHGVALGRKTWAALLRELEWTPEQVDKLICHQVGSAHRDMILKLLEQPEEKDFSTYEFLGNIGTVSLPLTAALAAEREFLQSGDNVAFLGIGSGLNCLMLGVEW